MRRLLIALTLAGAALRFGTLDLQSFWFDESVTVRLVRDDLFGMLGHIPDSESTPPLYYVLAWLWSKLFGTGEVGLRSLSALLGTATVPVAYAAAERLVSRRVGIAVAALAAFSPLLVWYSQEARSYALLGLLGATSLYAFARLLRGRDRQALWLWAGASALALTTHYFAIFLVAGEALLLLLRARRPGTGAALAAVAAAALALLPLAVHQGSLDLASFIDENSLDDRLLQVPKQLLVGYDLPIEAVLASAAGVVALAGAALAVRRRSPGLEAAAAVAAVALLTPVVVALAGADYLLTRNLIAAWLPLMTVVAAGLLSVRRGEAGVVLLCAVGLAGVAGTAVEPRWQRDDWRGVVEALGPTRTPRAVVLTPAEPGIEPFRLYDPGAEPVTEAGVNVKEVALVSTHGRSGNGIHPPAPPRPATVGFGGFRPIRRQYADDFTVIVFARPSPIHLAPSTLAAHRLLSREAVGLLLQRPH
jgi:mannosyltransferase